MQRLSASSTCRTTTVDLVLFSNSLSSSYEDGEVHSLGGPASAHKFSIFRPPARECLTSPLTVGIDLRKRSSAQR